MLPAFLDRRYVTVDGTPMFVVYNPTEVPDAPRVMDFWRNLAVKAGLRGLFLVAERRRHDWDPRPFGFDASMTIRLPPRRPDWVSWRQPVTKLRNKFKDWRRQPTVYQYESLIDVLIADAVPGIENYPCVIPNWDNTPRSGVNGLVLHQSTPEAFRHQVRRALQTVRDVPREHRFVFIKSWNEWAEGNHLEPDQKWGRAYLNELRSALEDFNHDA